MNSFASGVKLARLGNVPTTKVLVDFFHLSLEHESADHLAELGSEWLNHVHFANPDGRVYPLDAAEFDYQPFAQAVKASGYDARVSCEARTADFAAAAPKAPAVMKALFD